VDYVYLFYPEILSKMALRDIEGALDKLLEFKGKIVIFSYFLSRWALEELKNHPRWK
jgi:hypothetical protein